MNMEKLNCSYILIDELDMYILQAIFFKKTISTWEITKRYFSTNPKTKEELIICERHHNTLKKRLKKMKKWGIIEITKDKCNKNIYNLDKRRFYIKRHKFPEGYKKAILIKIFDAWCAFETR